MSFDNMIKKKAMNKLELKLSVDELNVILESLGHLPYARVYGLIANIQMQAQAQLEPGNGQSHEQQPQGAKNVVITE